MNKLINLSALILLSLIIFPIYWAVICSLTTEAQLFENASLWPSKLVFEHYYALFNEQDFLTPVKNSLIVAGITTIFCIIIGAACAYAIARLSFRGKIPILTLVLMVSMFPQISIVSPLYLLLRELHLINTYPGLIMPYLTFAMPLTIWFLVGFFKQLPQELEEAAQIDGASRFSILFKIVLPLAAPGIAASAIITFIYCWNEFLFALSFTLGPERQTMPVAIALLRGQYQISWGQIMAAAVISTLPVTLLVLLFQKRIIGGLTLGAVKR